MLLAVDIGNTTAAVGAAEKDAEAGYKILFTGRIPNDEHLTAQGYAARVRQLLRENGAAVGDVHGVIISSVVPAVLAEMREGMRTLFGKEPMLLTSESRLGLTLAVDVPEKVGRDRLCDAAWAAEYYPLPAVTVDLGTATTFNVIGEGRVFLGGAIAAGVSISLRALTERTAQLPSVPLYTPESIIGRNTEESIVSGIIAGTASMVDGMVRKFERELGKPVTLILTGGAASLAEPLIEHAHIYDRDLLLKGLALLYEKNT